MLGSIPISICCWGISEEPTENWWQEEAAAPACPPDRLVARMAAAAHNARMIIGLPRTSATSTPPGRLHGDAIGLVTNGASPVVQVYAGIAWRR